MTTNKTRSQDHQPAGSPLRPFDKSDTPEPAGLSFSGQESANMGTAMSYEDWFLLRTGADLLDKKADKAGGSDREGATFYRLYNSAGRAWDAVLSAPESYFTRFHTEAR
jgi:hypothetical protein